MKFAAPKEPFLKTLALVAQAVSSSPSLPVLGNLLLKADKGTLEATATNLETTITAKTPVKLEEAGGTTVSARTLQDFCQAAGGSDIKATLVRENLVVACGTAQASLPTISTTEFPSPTAFEPGETVEFDRDQFIETINSVAFCAAVEEGRPIFTGVLLHGDGKRLSLVATDGYRLAKAELKNQARLQAIMPAKALRDAAKALAGEEDTVELSVNKGGNQARIKAKNLTLTSRLLEGAFPDYEQIIPAEFPCKFSADTKKLLDAIRLAALFARDVGNVVKLEIKEAGLRVSGQTAAVGEAYADLEVSQTGERVKIAFNSRFLLECLGAISAPKTRVSLSGVTSATLLAGEGITGLVYVVMPVKTQS